MPAEPAAGDSQAVVERFVAGLAPDRQATTRRLHAAILATHPSFDVAIKYNLLMYAIAGDWRHWVVAVDAHPRGGVGLRFLYGVLMADPAHVLRRGSSVLMTWDLAPGADVDVAAVSTYVAEAVRLHPEFKAGEKSILESARAASAGRSKAG